MDQNTSSGGSPSGQPQNSGGGKKGMWIVIIVIVLALLAGYYFMHRSSSSSPKVLSLTPGSSGSGSGNGQLVNGQMTLKALMASPVPEKCNFTSTNGTTTTEGTVYVSNGEMRGDMTDGSRQSHVLNDGQNYYIWESDKTSGYKMSTQMVESMSANAQTNTQQQQEVDPNVSYNYNCDAWSADSSQFTPPGDITFQDMTSMMQNMQNAMPTGSGSPPQAPSNPSSNNSASMKAQECAACNSAGAQKAQCLAALGCNQ